MQENYDDWHKKFNEIKEVDIPKITDELIVIEDLFNERKYKELDEKIAKTELQIYYIKTKANTIPKFPIVSSIALTILPTS